MAAATSVKLNIHGVDKTGNVFAGIARHAKAIFATLGTGMAIKGIAGMINELGMISDISQMAGVASNELTSMSGAMKILGIQGASIQSVAQAMNYMTRATGEVGMKGFQRVLGAIGELPTAQERATAAMRVFGRSGMRFLPLIEAAAKDGGKAFMSLAEVYPSVSQKAADAGDAVADSWAVVWDGIKTKTLNVVGAICDWFDKRFTGGIRGAAFEAAAHFEAFVDRLIVVFSNFWDICAYRFKALGSGIVGTFKAVGNAIMDTVDVVMHGGSFDAVGELFKQSLSESWDDFANGWPDEVAKKMEEIDSNLEAKLKKIREANVGKSYGEAAKAMTGGGAMKDQAQGGKSAASASNKWINANSYEALTMGLRSQMRREDPQTKELKKSNNYLKKIMDTLGNPSEVSVLDMGAMANG